MPKPRRDKTEESTRKHRITSEILVDAYTGSERAMGWCYYLEGQLRFPFRARCIKRPSISPLHVADEVEVMGMAPEEECEHEMFVMIRWGKSSLAVPLSQLEGVKVDKAPRQGIEDWHYSSSGGLIVWSAYTVGARLACPTRSPVGL